MIKFGDYFLAQLKRIVKLLPGIVVMVVIVALAVAGISKAILSSDSYKEQHMKYKLGIVGSTEDDMLTMGVDLLKNNDESRFMLDIVRFDDAEEANAALRAGDISAYVLITDEFVDSLNALSNDVNLEYFATSGQRGITSVMMDELADIASNLVVSSEKGLLALEQEMKNAGYPAEAINPQVDRALLLYVGVMLARGDMVEVQELGVSDGLSTEEYYKISLSLFFMLLLTFCSISFFLRRRKAGYQFLAAKGLGPAGQVLGEFLPYYLLNLFCGEIVIGYVIKDRFNIAVATVLFSALGFAIFEVVSGVINKILAAFILYMGMSYISGYFYPRSFFTDVLQVIGRYLPTGVAFSYMEQGEGSLMMVLGYTVVFLLIAMLFRVHRIRQ